LDEAHVVVVGAGLLGGQVLDMLARLPNLRLTLVGRDEDVVPKRANLARLTAMHLGLDPKVNFAITDVTNIDRTAELIAVLSPDLLFTALSAQPYWMVRQLTDYQSSPGVNAGMAPWLPHQLAPLVSLMSACRSASETLPVVNAAFPDVTHAVLQSGGLAPYLGAGSVSNSVPALRLAASHLLEVPVHDVQVQFVAEAYVTRCIPRLGHSGGAPFHLTVLNNDADVTDSLDIGELLRLVNTRFSRPSDSLSVALTAAASVRIISAILNDEGAVVHAPGPSSLMGGYPVRVWSDHVEVIYPDGLTPDRAQQINMRSAKFNGIEELRQDGTVILTEPSSTVLSQLLGFPISEFHYSEAAAISAAMSARMRDSKTSA
jgi:hypothetical protein